MDSYPGRHGMKSGNTSLVSIGSHVTKYRMGSQINKKKNNEKSSY